jgi:hypothetical protein
LFLNIFNSTTNNPSEKWEGFALKLAKKLKKVGLFWGLKVGLKIKEFFLKQRERKSLNRKHKKLVLS